MKRATYHHGNLYQEVIDEALKTISTHGIHSLSLRKISAALHVSQSAPFRHFTSKEDLLVKIAKYGYEKINTIFAESRLDNEDPETALEKLAVIYGQFALNNPVLFSIMYKSILIKSEKDPLISSLYYYPYTLLTQILEKGIKKQLFRGDVTLMAISLRSIVHGFITLFIDKEITNLPYGNEPIDNLLPLVRATVSTWKRDT